MHKFEDIVTQYANERNLHQVFYIAKHEGLEVYLLHDKSLQGKKTGWPIFVTVDSKTNIVPVSDIAKINYFIGLCQSKSSSR